MNLGGFIICLILCICSFVGGMKAAISAANEFYECVEK